MNKKQYLYSFLLILSIFDCLITTVILNQTGIGAEVNPIMSFIISNYSYIGMWAIKFIVIVPIGFFIDKFSERFYVTLVVAFSIIVMVNLIGLIL